MALNSCEWHLTVWISWPKIPLNGNQWPTMANEGLGNYVKATPLYKLKKLGQNDLAFWRGYEAGFFRSALFCKIVYG